MCCEEHHAGGADQFSNMKWERGSMHGGSSESCLVDTRKKKHCGIPMRLIFLWLQQSNTYEVTRCFISKMEIQ